MRSRVQAADEEVSIVLVCQWLGMEVPELVWDRPSPKLRCPFGFLHDDYGVEPAFRIYQQSQSVYCFAGCGYFRPVSLCAAAWDLDYDSAAAELLRRVGYQMPGSEEQWQELSKRTEQVDVSQLERALRFRCGRKFDNWPACQYTEGGAVSGFLSRALGLLEHVETPDQADLWRSVVWEAVDRLAGQLSETPGGVK